MIIGILLLALGGGAVALHSVYTVRTVYVEGNVHYTEDEIMEIVMSGPLGDNSLYLSLKYRDRGIQDIPFVDVMNVSILAPDTIKITVYEKALAGYVKYLDTYMFRDPHPGNTADHGAFLQPCGAGRATAGGGSAGVFQDHGSDKAFEQIFTGCGQDLSAFFR